MTDIPIEKMFALWETMGQIEALLLDIYFEEFMGLCAEKQPDQVNDISHDEFPF